MEIFIMKTKEELDALKQEVETLNKKLHELTEEELEQVTGGVDFGDLGDRVFGDQLIGGLKGVSERPALK